MKKLLNLMIIFSLAGCGAMGIGSNHETNIFNNSKDTITVTSSSGIYKISSNKNLLVYSDNNLSISNPRSNCPQVNLNNKPNTTAIILDVFPGFMFGIIPIFVDAVTDNLYKMPSSYAYNCNI